MIKIRKKIFLLTTFFSILFLNQTNIIFADLTKITDDFKKKLKTRKITLSELTQTFLKKLPEYSYSDVDENKNFIPYIQKYKTPFVKSTDLYNDLLGAIGSIIYNYSNDLLEKKKNWVNKDMINTTDENEFYEQKITFGKKTTPIIIIGDLHGSLWSLIRICWTLVALKILDNNFKTKYPIIFLGDYVDRGPCGIEIWYLLSILKTVNNNKIILIRGNHESSYLNSMPPHSGGFTNELENKFPKDVTYFSHFMKSIYTVLPVNTYLNFNGNYISFRHGGINPFDKNIKTFLNQKDKKFRKINTSEFITYKNQNYYGYDGYNYSYFTDGKIPQFTYNDYKIQIKPNDTMKAGFLAGQEGTKKYLTDNNLKLIIRGHQHSGKYDTDQFIILDYKKGFLPWKNVINKNDRKDNQFTITDNNLVFTTYSCPIFQDFKNDCFLILEPKENNKINVKVYESKLKEKNRYEKYISIKPSKNKLQPINVKWSKQPLSNPISKKLIDIAKSNVSN
ncbi:serine/threonine protein phosphatase [Candidatus Babeliales bacterium]|nr:serine/threonine protein phosphatase [Candidatus Babeliales bacterium]